MSEIKSTDRPALAAAGEALAAAGAPLRARWIDETRWIDERGNILDRMWAPHIGAMCCLSKSAQGKAFVSIQGTHIHDLSSLLAAQHAAEQFAMAVVREQAAALGMAAVALPALAECRDTSIGSGAVWLDSEIPDQEPTLYTPEQARLVAAQLLACAAEAERRAAGEARA